MEIHVGPWLVLMGVCACERAVAGESGFLERSGVARTFMADPIRETLRRDSP